MTGTLKQNTIKSFLWNIFEKAGFQFIALLVGIFTARMLSPRDFGLIGALAIFTQLSNIFVESGFTSTMVRRKHNENSEYSAIFIINLTLGILFYLILFFNAPFISYFFEMPELTNLSRFLFLAILINSIGIIPNIILTRSLSFQKTATANMISAIVSAIVTVLLVIYGYEYWALAWQQITQSIVRSVFLWIFSGWSISRPNFRILKEIFSFSFILLITSVFSTGVRNLYNLVIGKLYSATELGYYTQANKFQSIPSNIISTAVTGVSYPVLSKLNEEKNRQLLYFGKIIRVIAFMIFPLMLLLFTTAEELVTIILTEKWLPAVPYFRILIIYGLIFPLHSMNVSFLIVKGYPKLNFQLEIFRNGLYILFLALYSSSIEKMLIGYSFATVLSYIADMIFVQRRTSYTMLRQLKDIFPYFAISVITFFVIKGTKLIHTGPFLSLILQWAIAGIFYVTVLKLLGSRIIEEMISLVKKKDNTENG
jgi:O-antigen/teichoic acid export membrane protein